VAAAWLSAAAVVVGPAAVPGTAAMAAAVPGTGAVGGSEAAAVGLGGAVIAGLGVEAAAAEAYLGDTESMIVQSRLPASSFSGHVGQSSSSSSPQAVMTFCHAPSVH
jgi:hypothetical protein